MVFFLTHFLSVTSRKNQKNSLRTGGNFSLTRLICFSLIECCFWFVTSQGQWKFKKRQKFTSLWVFCPSNEHNSNVQPFLKNKYTFTGRLKLCIVLESKPCQQLRRLLCYYYTNCRKTKFESSEIHLFDRNPFQNRWCGGSIAGVQAVDMGSIPVRCINTYDR